MDKGLENRTHQREVPVPRALSDPRNEKESQVALCRGRAGDPRLPDTLPARMWGAHWEIVRTADPKTR